MLLTDRHRQTFFDNASSGRLIVGYLHFGGKIIKFLIVLNVQIIVVVWCILIIGCLLVVGAAGLGTAATAATASAGGATAALLAFLI